LIKTSNIICSNTEINLHVEKLGLLLLFFETFLNLLTWILKYHVVFLRTDRLKPVSIRE